MCGSRRHVSVSVALTHRSAFSDKAQVTSLGIEDVLFTFGAVSYDREKALVLADLLAAGRRSD
jgi:ABC-type transporter Mla maintaining outer membrane lipid asymmetry permease subunit MlaE